MTIIGTRPGGPARALALAPLLIGILAMHVLLVCSGGDDMGMDASATHGSSMAGGSAAPAPAPLDLGSSGPFAAAVDIVAAPVTPPPHGSPMQHGAAEMCLAVLVGAGLLLAVVLASRRGPPRAAERVSHTWFRARRPRGPPSPGARSLLCVMRV